MRILKLFWRYLKTLFNKNESSYEEYNVPPEARRGHRKPFLERFNKKRPYHRHRKR